MSRDQSTFWDERYRREGYIWGEGPSPTAQILSMQLTPPARVLEVGFGYGRDLIWLATQGYRSTGIELSQEGFRLARNRLETFEHEPVDLLRGEFGSVEIPEQHFDAVLSHRVAHLMINPTDIIRFAEEAWQVLAPDGLLCVAARSDHDLNPDLMIDHGEGVHEYRDRPGHRIRYWNRETFEKHLSPRFSLLDSTEEVELESQTRPVPCHLLVLVARKNEPEPCCTQNAVRGVGQSVEHTP